MGGARAWALCLAVLALVDGINARIGTFWHVTDFHYDVNYTTTGDNTNMCWESSEPGEARLGSFGDYECDAPLALIQSAVDAMRDIQPDADFIMWTGDDTAHVDDLYFSSSEVGRIIGAVTDVVHRAFPSTPVLPVLGNHDFYPKNQVPPGESDLQSQVADLWRHWFTEDQYQAFKAHGRYSLDLADTNITVVALNTLLWYKSNDITLNDPDNDPDDQFLWLDVLLTALAKRGRQAYLMGHIPPGSFERYQQTTRGFHWYQDRFNTRFIQLVQSHSDAITAQFFAHHHTDSFRLFFTDGEAVSFQLLAPGVTPWRSTLSPETGANNPGIRLVTYDTDTGELIEVSTYYLDLAKANAQGTADWALLYNFTQAYSIDNITAASLQALAETMESNKELFDRYYTHNTVGLEDPSVCGEVCHRVQLCSITQVDYEDYAKCNGAGGVALGTATALLAMLVALFGR